MGAGAGVPGGVVFCGGCPSVEGRGGGRGVARVCACAAPEAASAKASVEAAIQCVAIGAKSFYRISPPRIRSRAVPGLLAIVFGRAATVAWKRPKFGKSEGAPRRSLLSAIV